jgi:hypothetical protein
MTNAKITYKQIIDLVFFSALYRCATRFYEIPFYECKFCHNTNLFPAKKEKQKNSQEIHRDTPRYE